MAAYTLIGSYSTVQVLSPTVTNNVEYCTIQTSPSGVIASRPIEEFIFNAGEAGTYLTVFAESIESVMKKTGVVAGVGSQQLDPNGLLEDQVTFTVQYVPTGATTGAITAEVPVPVTLLDFAEEYAGATNEQAVDALLSAALANLRAAASG